jgi:hypothetical protein
MVRVSRVAFVDDEVALGRKFLRVLRSPLAIPFHRGSPNSYIIWVMNNVHIADHRSWTYSHHIDMSNNNNEFRNLTLPSRSSSKMFKNLVRTSKRTSHFTIIKINLLTLFKEIIADYNETHTRPINTE